MAKVFRTHSTGQHNEDWFQSNQINSEVIENLNVKDMQGSKQPTSVPSPFARIDLVRAAFSKVTNPDKYGKISIDGRSDAHKLVSDSLDVGQMLFNYERHKKILSIEKWSKKESLEKLRGSENKKHVHLAETLELFLEQDAGQYNYDKMDDIFILKYDHQVIGGTSPRTLFFASPRSEHIDVNIKFAQDKMLDEEILPLFKREPDYIKYLFSLKQFVPNFNSIFKEFSAYLSENLDVLQNYNNELYRELNNIDETFYDGLSVMSMPGMSGVPMEVIQGVQLRVASEKDPDTSDFKLRSSKKIKGKVPLVLPVDSFTKNWVYTTGKWDSNTKVPIYDDRPLSERLLPDQNDRYPYLTMNDFLSPTIIKLPYKIDQDRFLVMGDSSFLIPLKKRFFEYFEVNNIGKEVKVEIEEQSQYGGLVKVRLFIPVTKDGSQVVEYKKVYRKADGVSSLVNESSKEGQIFDASIGLSIWPFVKGDGVVPVNYDLGVVSMSKLNGEVKVNPLNSENLMPLDAFRQVRSTNPDRKTEHVSFAGTFDMLEVSVNGATNFLFPKLKESNKSNKAYSFAIDFGTTNTHVEVQVLEANDRIDPFEISQDETQIVYLRDRSVPLRGQNKVQVEDGEDYLKQESIPETISEKAIHKFPLRTNIIENEVVDYSVETRVFTDCNIGFDFEKQSIKPYLSFKTELKWSDVTETANRTRILRYIEEVLMLCKNKVLLNNGDLSKTSFVWFYPISMTGSRKNVLRGIWNEAIDKVFGNSVPEGNVKSISESIAPFYYYQRFEGIMVQTAPALSIDIGGGTTDVVVFERGNPALISSFKYAGNSIFGDGLNKNPKLNGFVTLFKDKYENLLSSNELSNELGVLQEILNKTNRSSDFVNFLFSLDDNVNVGSHISFETELRENFDLKLVFLIYFSALFYHIAQLMKMAGIDKPASILFSGTGSKSIFILNGDKANLHITETLINEVVDFVYSNERSSKVKITIDKNPKEITSKGGLSLDQEMDRLHELVTIHLGGKQMLSQQKPLNEGFQNINYSDISDHGFEDVMANVSDFFAMLDDIKGRVSFNRTFGVTTKANQALAEILEDDRQLLDYLILGYKAQKEDSGDSSEPIEETLFFYPIIGVLNDLAYRISQTKN